MGLAERVTTGVSPTPGSNLNFKAIYYNEWGIVSWLSRGPISSSEVWIGCKRLILKLSLVSGVKLRAFKCN